MDAGYNAAGCFMPTLEPRSPTTSGPTTDGPVTGPARTPTGPQSTLGNAEVAARLRDESQSGAAAGDSLWAGAHAASPRLTRPKMRDGRWVVLTADQVSGVESADWERLAEAHGMMARKLVAFNQHIATASDGADTALMGEAAAPKLAAGVRVYIPSADELLFAECAHRAGGDLAAATSLFSGVAAGSNLPMLRVARERASGQLGLGYGTPGDAGVFYSPNPGLNGASERRTSTINGQKEYRVNWGPDFWKCSVFLHDVAYAAGWKPDVAENKHYRLAGQLHLSKDYKEIPVKQAKPGAAWQRFGGTRSNESHNAILSSFVTVTPVDDTWEDWSFTIIGAETDRAAESDRLHRVRKGTNETNDGKRIRFFEPRSRR
jgi:hypothetical protein